MSQWSYSAYFRAVERLESAIKKFVVYAKSTGWDNLTPEERVQQSLTLENYYQRQEVSNKPLRVRDELLLNRLVSSMLTAGFTTLLSWIISPLLAEAYHGARRRWEAEQGVR